MEHGTLSRYVHRDPAKRCRCAACKRANAAHQREYRRRRSQQGKQLVSSLGAQRRLRALQAMGWPLLMLGRHLHHVFENDRIRRVTHEQVVRLYEEYCMRPGPDERIRLMARNRGYPPPLAWDDIDDPDEDPSPHLRAA